MRTNRITALAAALLAIGLAGCDDNRETDDTLRDAGPEPAGAAVSDDARTYDQAARTGTAGGPVTQGTGDDTHSFGTPMEGGAATTGGAADTGAGTGTAMGTTSGAGVVTGTATGADTGTGTGATAGAGTATGAGTDTGTGSEAGTGTGSNATRAPGNANATASSGGLGVAITARHVPYVADSDGQAVYFLEEGSGSGCTGACLQAWPPVLASGGSLPDIDPALDGSLLAAVERSDGTTQITYNGHRLHYRAANAGAAPATGQSVRDDWGEWSMLTPKGARFDDSAGGASSGNGGAGAGSDGNADATQGSTQGSNQGSNQGDDGGP
jgi:predicted lipoprotein with Yx(FWY)xxD motif